MQNDMDKTQFFCEYYKQWIEIYKRGAIREATMAKYLMTQKWLEKLIPELKVEELTRTAYQQLLNDYAKEHERQTTLDFHHQLKGAILDALDEGMIKRDPTRKAIIKGKTPRAKKIKYLNQFELHTLLADLELKETPDWDWFLLLVAKTGMRFSEALAITPEDFDFSRQTLSISKTWDYKGAGGFLPTKNKSSVRKIQIDWQIVVKFSELIKNLPQDQPIFVGESKIYNSTVNNILSRHCKECGISEISIHGLRHTHASLLLFAGVSIASVARRLGHASMTTTQKTYLHIIQELENKDVDLVAFFGGRAAEEVKFNTITTGASNDIERATAIARAMVTQYGMSEEFGLIGLESITNRYLDGRAVMNCAETTAAKVDEVVMKMLKEAYAKAVTYIRENMDILDEAAQFLIKRETITGKEFMEIFNKYKNPEKESEKNVSETMEKDVETEKNTQENVEVSETKTDEVNTSTFNTGYAQWVEDDDDEE